MGTVHYWQPFSST